MNFKIFLAIALCFVLNPQKTKASNDINITCDKKNCSSQQIDSFFSVVNLAPEDTVSQKIIINNTRNQNCSLSFVNFKNNGANSYELAKNLIVKIESQTPEKKISYPPKIVFEKNLNELFKENLFDQNIKAKKITEFLWTLTLDKNSPNEIQGSNLNFKFDMNFVCGLETNIIEINSNPLESLKVLGTQIENTELRNLIKPYYKSTKLKKVQEILKPYWLLILLIQIIFHYLINKMQIKKLKVILQHLVSIPFLIIFLILEIWIVAIISFILAILAIYQSLLKKSVEPASHDL